MTAPIPRWAKAELKHAELGDRRLGRRAQEILAQIFRRKGGTLSRVFPTSAARQGAYRFVDNLRVSAEALLRSAALATLLRVDLTALYFFVLLDFSFLSFSSPSQKKVLGPTGTSAKRGSGLIAMTGLVFSSQGVPLGLGSQHLFVRSKKVRRRLCPRCRKRQQPRKRKGACSHVQEARRKRALAQKETRFWLEAIQHVLDVCSLLKLKALPWFQCDRGADFWELLEAAATQPVRVTVRANANRRVRGRDQDRKVEEGLVKQVLKHSPLRYRTTQKIPAGPKRKERTASLEVRARRVMVKRKKREVELGVVWVNEVGKVPRGEKRLEWLLWTTAPVGSCPEIKEVVRGYTLRWQIEVFHKTWKSVLGVEESQLRSPHGLKVWSTLQAIVATRIQRLLRRSRQEPEAKASEELTSEELEAVRLMGEEPLSLDPKEMTLAQAVDRIARVGGYTGKSSGGPPGAITLGRGLQEVEVIATFLKVIQDRGDPDLLRKLLRSVR